MESNPTNLIEPWESDLLRVAEGSAGCSPAGCHRVLIKPSAVRELEAVPRKDRSRLAERIQNLGAMPWPVGCEKLSGGDRYRVRQGDYRIIYSVDDAQRIVRVVKVGHRSEVHR